MGKSNYSILKNYGLNNFWSDSWVKIHNKTSTFLFTIYIKKLIQNILKNYFEYSFFFKVLENSKNSILIRKYFNFYNKVIKNNYFLGKIWLLENLNYIIIVINILISKKNKKNKSLNRVIKVKKFKHSFINIYFKI